MKYTVIFIFAVSMAFLESAVVIYLRELLYPNGFEFPLQAMSNTVIVTELFRELATLIMLVTIGYLAASKLKERIAVFLIAFAIWDIFYYVFLCLFLNWPAHMMDWDILFLIPFLWTGPVISPILICISMLVFAYLLINKKVYLNARSISLIFAGIFICLWAFMAEYIRYHSSLHLGLFDAESLLKSSLSFVPQKFPWSEFITGYVIIWTGIAASFKPIHSAAKKSLPPMFI